MTLPLFQPDGVLRPPGVPETARPGDGFLRCPKCGLRTLFWDKPTKAKCDALEPPCDYVWRRDSAQLDHTEPIPF